MVTPHNATIWLLIGMAGGPEGTAEIFRLRSPSLPAHAEIGV